MPQRRFYFLSGLPRSGSTLLGSILNQNPQIYVSPTSPFLDLFFMTNQSLANLNQRFTFDFDTVSRNIYSAIADSFYKHIEKPVIIDKNRGWPKNVVPVKMFIDPDPKIIATHRPVAELVVSYLKLINKDPNNFIDAALEKKGLPFTTENRARTIWEDYAKDPYLSLKIGLEQHRANIHLVDYNELVTDPDKALNGIYDFLGMERHRHGFANISNSCAEAKDEAWGLKDLHTIRTKLEKTSDDPVEVLGQELTGFFRQFDLNA